MRDVIPPNFISVLRLLVSGLEVPGVEWAITGSLGMALQGMPLDVHDIDLQSDLLGALEIQRRFADCSSRPVVFSAKQRIRSYLGALLIEGVVVEIIGHMQKRLDNGNWEPPVRVGDHRLWIERLGMRLPVLSLEYEYGAYTLMGRLERARVIRDWLQHKPTPDKGDV